MRKTPLMILGLLAGSLVYIAACGFPTQTTFGVGNEGGLRMLVIPDDAVVYVNGASMGPVNQYRGRTFIRLKNGKHVVEIQKAGYATYREEVFVSNNMVTLTVTLKKE